MARRDTYIIEFRTTGAARVRRDIATIGRQANSTRRALSFLRSFLVVFASVQIFAGIFKLADAFTNLTNRIKILSDDANVVSALRSEIFALANELRLPVEELNETFVRITRSSLRLGLNFAELLDITRAVGIAVQISGASAQEAAGGLRQFSQGLASGALQSEELRSVAENLQGLSDIIAKEFRPELEKFGLVSKDAGDEGLGGLLIPLNNLQPGILRTSRIIKALDAEFENLLETFEKFRPTISQAFSIFRNRVIQFAGNLEQTTGIASTLAETIIALSRNVDILIASFAAFVGIVIFNLIISQVVALGVRILSLAQGFLKVGAAVAKFGALAVRALTTLSGFLAGSAIIAGLTIAWYRWSDAIEETIDDLGGLANIAKVTLAFIIGIIRTVRDEWELVVDALPAIWLRAWQKIIEIVGSAFTKLFDLIVDTYDDIIRATVQLGGEIGGIIGNVLIGNFSEAERIARSTFGDTLVNAVSDPVKTAGEAVADLSAYFEESGKSADQLGKILETNVAIAITDINKVLADLTTPGETIDLSAVFPKGSSTSEEIQKITKEQQRLIDTFRELLASVDPYIDRIETLKEAQDDYAQGLLTLIQTQGKAAVAAELAAGTILTQEEVLKRVDREFLGVGNTVTDVAAKMKNLDEAYKRDRISTIELAIAQKALREELAGEAADLERSVSPFLSAQNELIDAQNTLNLARSYGAELTLSNAEILRRVERDILGVGNATAIYEEKQKLLNDAVGRGVISQEEFRLASIRNRIEVLDDQRTVAAGVERAMLRIEEAYGNTAANVEQAFTTVFQNLEDKLVDFVETGKFEFQDLVDTIQREITRIFVREAIGEAGGIFNDIFGTAIPGVEGGGKEAEAAASQAAATANQALATASTAAATPLGAMGTTLIGLNTALAPLPATMTVLKVAADSAAAALTNLAASANASAGSSGAEGGGSLFGVFGSFASSLFEGGGTEAATGQGAQFTGTGAEGLASSGSFATGGSFSVGPRTSENLGGIDNRLVQFRAQDGEQVDIIPRGQTSRRQGNTVNVNVYGVTDVDKFKRNTTQIQSKMSAALNRASQRTG